MKFQIFACTESGVEISQRTRISVIALILCYTSTILIAGPGIPRERAIGSARVTPEETTGRLLRGGEARYEEAFGREAWARSNSGLKRLFEILKREDQTLLERAGSGDIEAVRQIQGKYWKVAESVGLVKIEGDWMDVSGLTTELREVAEKLGNRAPELNKALSQIETVRRSYTENARLLSAADAFRSAAFEGKALESGPGHSQFAAEISDGVQSLTIPQQAREPLARVLEKGTALIERVASEDSPAQAKTVSGNLAVVMDAILTMTHPEELRSHLQRVENALEGSRPKILSGMRRLQEKMLERYREALSAKAKELGLSDTASTSELKRALKAKMGPEGFQEFLGKLEAGEWGKSPGEIFAEHLLDLLSGKAGKKVDTTAIEILVKNRCLNRAQMGGIARYLPSLAKGTAFALFATALAATAEANLKQDELSSNGMAHETPASATGRQKAK